MGGKKKGKGNKLSKMSEEEKIRYLQHRAAIEEEARRRKEELISTFLKKKLKREQIFSRLNLAKINQQWRQILRQIKCSELKQELEELSKWFECTVAKKNEMINTLIRDLNKAEEQYSQLRRSQMETIDKLITIYQRRVDHFREKYEQEKNCMHRKAVTDVGEIKNSSARDEEQLQITLHRMEESFNEKTSRLTSAHFNKMEEVRNNMLTDLENLKNSRESRVDKIWQDFESVLKGYRDQTEERRKKYVEMRDSDRENRLQIFRNNQLINGAIELVESEKEKLAKIRSDSDEVVSTKKMEREKIRKIFRESKEMVARETEMDRKKLNCMNSAAVESTEELKRILEKGKEILRLHSLCRKLEAVDGSSEAEEEEEKIKIEEEEQEFERELVEPVGEPVEPEMVFGGGTELEGFWKSYNRVFLEKKALDLHFETLLREKKRLKSELKNYFSDYVVKRPESKVSFPIGIRFSRRRPATGIPTGRNNQFRVSSVFNRPSAKTTG